MPGPGESYTRYPLHRWLTANRVSQSGLAERLGVSQNAIWKAHKRTGRVSLSLALAIAVETGIPAESLPLSREDRERLGRYNGTTRANDSAA